MSIREKRYICPRIVKIREVSKISFQYISLLFIWVLSWPAMTLRASEKSFTIVIDAGHGGKDPGARGTNVNEKTINLSVALKLGKLIENNAPDVRVIYTRTTDRFIELDERANIANRNKADLFMSIHTNAVRRGSSVQGTETYTLGLARSQENLEVAMSENAAILLEDNYLQRYEGFDPNSSESYIIFELMQNKHMEQSISLASDIQNAFSSSGRVDRGVRQAGFLVLRETSMPSVLVELGYISNRNEEQFMNSSKGQDLLARSLYKAFANYKRNFDLRSGKPVAAVVMEPEMEEDLLEATEEQADRKAPPGSEADILSRKREAQKESASEQSSGKTVYKVQFLTSETKLSKNSKRLKGYKDAEYYVEDGIYKYTYGSTTSFSEINRIRRSMLKDFKDAFVISFKDGERVR